VLLEQNLNSTNNHAYSPPSTIIADTGAAGHFVTIDAPHKNKQVANPRITVVFPNGDTLHSTHTVELTLPLLARAACQAHIFDNLDSGSLISIGQLCDHGCTAIFDKTQVTVSLDTKIVLQGSRSPSTKLWHLNVPPSSAHTVNIVTKSQNLSNRIAFFHAAMFSPSLSTFCDAIDAGHLTTWPDLTSAQVRQNPPTSIAMVKGHLDQERANIRSTKTKKLLPKTTCSEDLILGKIEDLDEVILG